MQVNEHIVNKIVAIRKARKHPPQPVILKQQETISVPALKDTVISPNLFQCRNGMFEVKWKGLIYSATTVGGVLKAAPIPFDLKQRLEYKALQLHLTFQRYYLIESL